MRRTMMATAVALAVVASGPAWAQDTEPAPGTAPGTTADATTQPVASAEAATTSELPATASPIALLAAGGVLSLVAGALLIRRRY